MLYNFLDAAASRAVLSCNYNQHIASRHPDRIMQAHDLIYIREGAWEISQDGVDYPVHAGDVILLQGGHHHYGRVQSSSPVKTCYIHFSTSGRDYIAGRAERAQGQYSFPMVVPCADEPIIEKSFRAVIDSFWTEREYRQEQAAAHLTLLLCALSRKLRRSAGVVEDVQRLIRKTPNRFISNAEAAAFAHCSIRTLSAKFKAETGCSLHAWQLRMKCRMADEWLCCEPDITLKEVAATYGFCDEYHFGKCFKKVMGRSPKSFRQKADESGQTALEARKSISR